MCIFHLAFFLKLCLPGKTVTAGPGSITDVYMKLVKQINFIKRVLIFMFEFTCPTHCVVALEESTKAHSPVGCMK